MSNYNPDFNLVDLRRCDLQSSLVNQDNSEMFNEVKQFSNQLSATEHVLL